MRRFASAMVGAACVALVGDGHAAPPSAEKSGASPQAVSLPQGPAKLQGLGESFSVQLSSGTAQFRLPIEAPAARGAAQPSLSLAYASTGGHGVAGVGWTLPVAFIARQTDRGIPSYDDPPEADGWHPGQDRFVFGGGQELVPICLVTPGTLDCDGAQVGEVMPSWSGGWQYFRARVEGAFLRFFWSPDHTTWLVQSRDGITLELGAPQDGSGYLDALETAPTDPSRIFRWNVVRQYDARREAGTELPTNILNYRYLLDGGVAYLSDVYHTPPRQNAASAPLHRYAHHVRFRYEPRPDPATSYRRGWRTDAQLRVAGVDVTSKPYQTAIDGSRELVRRYLLTYRADRATSLLESLQVEGRCAAQVFEDASASLPPPGGCPRLPPARFAYQEVAGYSGSGAAAGADLAGFEAFDDRPVAMSGSPKQSIDGSTTDLFDVDADALPDVLVTNAALFRGRHGVYRQTTAPDAFEATSIGVAGVLGADASVIALSNVNVSVQDADGDGRVDLLHMPKVKTYGLYVPTEVNGLLTWQGRPITTAAAQSPYVDFTNQSPRIRTMDVDADGLVDIVFTTGTEVQTFFSLGRYPGGDGQFGHASWSGASTAVLSNEPVTACLPWSSTPVRFDDPDVRVGDLNGDGLPDLVRLRPGDIRYWPGRGNGFFGTGELDDCPGGSFAQARHVVMDDGPFWSKPNEVPRLADMNGDGRDDLVQVRAGAVDIWLNTGNDAWTERHIVQGTPLMPAGSNRVRLADMNGSGSTDILFGNGLDYRYVDPTGGVRPWLLRRITSDLGATTELEYESSVQQMRKAASGGEPWATVMPVATHVVSRATQRNNLEKVGGPAGSYVTEYEYRDPLYEGRQREFRGFELVRTKQDGDASQPSGIVETRFLLGECVDSTATGVDDCALSERWRENQEEALKGLPLLEERRDASQGYLQTRFTAYRLRTLYEGLDGRLVRHAFPEMTSSYQYDSAPFQPSVSQLQVVAVQPENLGGGLVQPRMQPVTVRSSARSLIRGGTTMDVFGVATAMRAEGCVEGCASLDEPIEDHFVPYRPPGDTSGWLWLMHERWVSDGAPGAAKLRHTTLGHDADGNLLSVVGELSGTLPLDRFHADGLGTAPPPLGASVDGPVALGQRVYDDFGNIVSEARPGGGCATFTYDAPYGHLMTGSTELVGPEQNGCGVTALTTAFDYDRGLGVTTTFVEPRGEQSRIQYDGFGRPVAAWKPHPEHPGQQAAQPTVTFEYLVPASPDATPFYRIGTRTQDGLTPDEASYHETWTYFDALGRVIVELSEADVAAGDDAPWLEGGRAVYGAKGAVVRRHEPAFYAGDPAAYPLSQAPTTAFTEVDYDAFGRVLETRGLDGVVDEQIAYHAASQDISDGEDLGPGPHQSTPATIVFDGHGRRTSVLERAHVGQTIEVRSIHVAYSPLGAPLVVTRAVVGGLAPPVARWIRYDTMGRMVLNVDPSASQGFSGDPTQSANAGKAWRYVYDDAGALVGTSDARGCGVNYVHDTAGRLVGEDYSPCTSEHAAYSTPDLATGDGLEVAYRYDAPDPATGGALQPVPGLLLGRLSSVAPRGSHTAFAYDGRGRTTAVARRMARPGPSAEDMDARYAPRWYTRAFAYDAADRTSLATTGAEVPELLGQSGLSRVAVEYSARGLTNSIGGSYGLLRAGSTWAADGAPREQVLADAASTVRAYGYDQRRRLHTVQTFRGGAWSSPPSGYLPPPPTSGGPSTLQLLLEDTELLYDRADNPVVIRDWRTPTEWPQGAKPVTRELAYDDLYRLTSVSYVHAQGTDAWVAPFEAEANGASDPRRGEPQPWVGFPQRVQQQTLAYDWLGNVSSSDDDAHGFMDRSLGGQTHGEAGHSPYQLTSATNETAAPGAPGDREGRLQVAYDPTGNATGVVVVRTGPCFPAGAVCSQRYAYDWDEVGRLQRARRWDLADPGTLDGPLPAGAPAADLAYQYDEANQRTLKTATDPAQAQRHALYIFGSLELRGAEWLEESDPSLSDYERSALTEVVQLEAGGVRLGRLHYETEGAPTIDGQHLHVLLELGDHLGSTETIIDRATGELVQKTSYTAFGSTDSDYRPARWKGFREDYRFTGNEEDVEVGLTYFGERYYAAMLSRWISADPLTVHGLGADFNPYAYVRGRALARIDPFGLDDAPPELTQQYDSDANTYYISETLINIPQSQFWTEASKPPPLSTAGGGANAGEVVYDQLTEDDRGGMRDNASWLWRHVGAGLMTGPFGHAIAATLVEVLEPPPPMVGPNGEEVAIAGMVPRSPSGRAAAAAEAGQVARTNWRGQPVKFPEGHVVSPREPSMAAEPNVDPGPFTDAQRAGLLRGSSGGTKLAPHHRQQIPIRDGGVMDELWGPGHPLGNQHTAGSPGRHPGPSVFRAEGHAGKLLRAREIRAHWRGKGMRLQKVGDHWYDFGPE